MRSHHQNAPPLAFLVALSALGVLPFNMFVPSMPSIAAEFETDYATINVAVAGYAVITAFTHLIAGALSDRLGRRPVLLAALAIFVIGSIGSCFAGNVYIFLGFRLLQGSAVAGFAMSLAMIRDTAGERMVSQIGYVSSAYAVAPIVWNRADAASAAHNFRTHVRLRAEVVADAAQLDPDRVQEWTFVRLVLNAVWAAEYGRPADGFRGRMIALAKAFSDPFG